MKQGKPASSSLLDRWRKGVPITLKALILTALGGLMAWGLLDLWEGDRLERLFTQHRLAELDEKAKEDRIHLDNAVRDRSQMARLLAGQKAFEAYVATRETEGWVDTPQPEIVYHNRKTRWLPPSSLLRGNAHIPYILLLDPLQRVREAYQVSRPPLPTAFLEGAISEVVGMDSANAILEYDDKPYLITTAALRGENQLPRGWLALVSPLDNDFLISFEHRFHTQGIVVFIKRDATQILASSRPDLIPSGTELATLEKEYYLLGKEFLDYGFYSETILHFATLIPATRLKNLEASIRTQTRTWRATSQLFLISVFFIIVFWIAHNIEKFTRSMVTFAYDHLGLKSTASLQGDQLALMGDQFQTLTSELLTARQKDADQAQQLKDSNEALRSSLEMVKRTQTQLVQSEKMAALGGLVAGISHEINTPVGIGVTAASHLERKTQECADLYQHGTMKRSDLENYFETATESTEMILTNLQRAADLIRSFKQVAVDQSTHDCRDFLLREYIDKIMISLGPRLKKTRHTFDIVCDDKLLIKSRPGAFSQIITNLVINSLNHGFQSNEGGHIKLVVIPQGEEILIRYQDNGMGIPKEFQHRIFEPFFTTKRGQGGSGLGMHIVYNLITRNLKGTILCLDAPDGGAQFDIRIPFSREECEELTE
ncbi:MAG: HAMP domain-containing histidine kinase [Magnetococcales bacterium]|nr:HAMP domain-containing histidine kinase [Magnetococcales bacterium]